MSLPISLPEKLAPMLRFLIAGLALVSARALAAPPAAPKIAIYDFNLPDIDGKMMPLFQFKGKVLLIVNTASDSSCTPQYAGLEALYRKYKDAGLVVLGIPSNDFGNQEPAAEAKIKSFVAGTYHVTFPLFSKVEVRGDNITPLFHYLTSEANAKIKGDVHWNFTKFLIDRKGSLVARFDFDTEPDSPDLLVALEDALAGKKSGASPQTQPVPPPPSDREPPTRSRE